jgi:alpha-beta hydrolase superfamily lysophospholipase
VSALDGASTWRGEGLAREAFYFDVDGVELFGSLYRAEPVRRGLGVVVCGTLSLEAIKSLVPQRLAAGVARAGGCALVFHYPGSGDSFGPVDASFAELRAAAVAAVAEARRRVPEVRWGLAGLSVGAAVAAAAAEEAAVEELLLLEPALDPVRWLDELVRASARSNLLGSADDGFAYGAPVPPLAPAQDPVALLRRFSGRSVVVRSEENPPQTPLPDGIEVRSVPGKWARWREEAPALVEAALAWLDEEPAGDGPALVRSFPRPGAGPGGIVERPAFVPTSRGPLGAVVANPPGEPRARLLFLHGNGDSRAGVNAHWTRTLRAVAALGIQVLRADWAGKFESDLAGAVDEGDRIPPVTELAAWFRACGNGEPLLVLGSCFGANAALYVAPEIGDIAALALVVPPLFPPRKRFLRRRDASAPDELDPDAAPRFAALLERTPVWLLSGADDGDYPAAAEAALGADRASRIEHTVLPGQTLHAFQSAATQEAAHAEIVAWAARTLGAVA